MGNQETIPRQAAMVGEMFQKVIDHIPVMLLCYDGAANPLLVNSEFTRLLGWTLEDARKVDLMAECYPDPVYRKEARAYMASAEPGWRDFRVRTRDGRIVETSWANVHLSDGSHIGIGIDVSERRRVEQELLAETIVRAGEEKVRESEERFSQFFELVPELMNIASVDGHFRKLNQAWERTLGYTAEELLGSPYLGFVHPEDVRRTEEEVEKIIAGTHERNFVNRYRCKDGTYRWLQWNSVFRKEEGNFFAVARDITEQKRAIAALKESEEKFHRAFLFSPLPKAISTSGQGRFIDVNTAYETLTGYRREELIGRTTAEFSLWANPADREKFVGTLVSAGEVRDVETQVRTRDGRLVPGLLSGTLVEIGGEECLLSVFTDLTRQKAAEEAVRESEMRFRSLAERMPQPVYETDGDGRITYVNEHGWILFGYPAEELTGGMSIFDLLDPADREKGRETFRKRVEEGFEGPKEYTWVRKDGTKFPAIAYAAPRLREGRSAGTVGVLMDLSALRKAEGELVNAQKYEAVGRLAGGIAHHLNNLMTVVAGYGTLIIDRMDVRDPWRREVEEMRRAGERAARLTAQLLAYSRRQILRPERIEPGRFLAEIEEELRGAAGPGARVSVLHDPGGYAILSDRELLRDALLRLVENSGRAMPGGGTVVILSRKSVITGEGGLPVPIGKYAMISVTDTGVGMDAETRSHVFEPFFTTRQVGDGTGLSLPSVYGFVKQSKGYIFVESEPGKGTTVSIYLPLLEP
jgi:two-component system cell cycle sensor histidine kinase/response regulator CckA